MTAGETAFLEWRCAIGKWSNLKGDLPRLQVDDQNWQSKVNFRKTSFNDAEGRTLGLGALGAAFNKVRAEKDELNDQLGDVNISLEALSQLLIDGLEATGLTSIRLEDGSTLTIKDEPYSKVTDREKYVDWVRAQGLDTLLQVNFMSTNALVKERLENGEEAPDGVEVFMKTSITRRKG